jgi:hypothetical protein
MMIVKRKAQNLQMALAVKLVSWLIMILLFLHAMEVGLSQGRKRMAALFSFPFHGKQKKKPRLFWQLPDQA